MIIYYQIVVPMAGLTPYLSLSRFEVGIEPGCRGGAPGGPSGRERTVGGGGRTAAADAGAGRAEATLCGRIMPATALGGRGGCGDDGKGDGDVSRPRGGGAGEPGRGAVCTTEGGGASLTAGLADRLAGGGPFGGGGFVPFPRRTTRGTLVPRGGGGGGEGDGLDAIRTTVVGTVRGVLVDGAREPREVLVVVRPDSIDECTAAGGLPACRSVEVVDELAWRSRACCCKLDMGLTCGGGGGLIEGVSRR